MIKQNLSAPRPHDEVIFCWNAVIMNTWWFEEVPNCACNACPSENHLAANCPRKSTSWLALHWAATSPAPTSWWLTIQYRPVAQLSRPLQPSACHKPTRPSSTISQPMAAEYISAMQGATMTFANLPTTAIHVGQFFLPPRAACHNIQTKWNDPFWGHAGSPICHTWTDNM